MTNSLRRIITTNIHLSNQQETCEKIIAWAQEKMNGYITVANVQVVMSSFWRKPYQQIINQATLVIPDSTVLVWGLRSLGGKRQTSISSAKLMLLACDRAQEAQIPIYLYGSNPLILAKLERNLRQWYPYLVVAGSHAPSFQLSKEKEAETDIEAINQSGASLIFVSLESPKQEEWMAKQVGKIQGVMVGVGRAFAKHTEKSPPLPSWVTTLRVEWLYDLLTQPKRYWRQYLIDYPIFFLLLTLQLIQHRVSSVIR